MFHGRRCGGRLSLDVYLSCNWYHCWSLGLLYTENPIYIYATPIFDGFICRGFTRAVRGHREGRGVKGSFGNLSPAKMWKSKSQIRRGHLPGGHFVLSHSVVSRSGQAAFISLILFCWPWPHVWLHSPHSVHSLSLQATAVLFRYLKYWLDIAILATIIISCDHSSLRHDMSLIMLIPHIWLFFYTGKIFKIIHCVALFTLFTQKLSNYYSKKCKFLR